MGRSEGLNVTDSSLCLFESVVRMLHFHFHVNVVMRLKCQTNDFKLEYRKSQIADFQCGCSYSEEINSSISQFRFIVAVREINIHPLTRALYLHNRGQHVSEGDAGNSGVCGT